MDRLPGRVAPLKPPLPDKECEGRESTAQARSPPVDRYRDAFASLGELREIKDLPRLRGRQTNTLIM